MRAGKMRKIWSLRNFEREHAYTYIDDADDECWGHTLPTIYVPTYLQEEAARRQARERPIDHLRFCASFL